MKNQLERVKHQIAQLYAQRETLKSQLELKQFPLKEGLKQLEKIDAELSILDTQFKHLWDDQN